MHLILPMLRPLILVVLLLRFIGAFKLFDEIYALTQAGPPGATETLAYYIYVLGFQAFEWATPRPCHTCYCWRSRSSVSR